MVRQARVHGHFDWGGPRHDLALLEDDDERSMTEKGRVAVNAAGRRIGETHHNSVVPDAVVQEIRRLREEEELTYRELAERFELSWHTIGKICRYERREQVVDRWKPHG